MFTNTFTRNSSIDYAWYRHVSFSCQMAWYRQISYSGSCIVILYCILVVGNAIQVPFVYVILVIRDYIPFSDFSHEVREIISRLWQFKWEIIALFWPYLIIMAAFITFVFWNGSIVLGTNSHFCSFVSLWSLPFVNRVCTHFFSHPCAIQVQKRLTRFLHILHN